MTPVALHGVTVIGCGLIGTSIALALTRAGVQVSLTDHEDDVLDRAWRMGAGTPLAHDQRPADLVVIATQASAAVDTLYEAQARGLGHSYTDIAGSKREIWQEAELRACDLWGYLPGHPVVGPDLRHPDAARADLFAERPWILCPYPLVEPAALAAADELVSLCGGRRRDMTLTEHDRFSAAQRRPTHSGPRRRHRPPAGAPRRGPSH
ncbi:prephenate dehydrogenase/arogenate dehydrogenase family protein [Streptomyces sp. NPDC096152]|uniref:prephenate dehydrogenase/arogenate dehydrogenase family protein n=1 Tax=Streptomyces sp. NPDC096152 TaxID=3366078 RepID=UPI0038188B14